MGGVPPPHRLRSAPARRSARCDRERRADGHQVAKLFGAAEVIGAGREEVRLAALRADGTCTFDQAATVADIDVVIDYVWGEPAPRAMVDMLKARRDRSHELTWIQIGSVAGAEAPIPSVALRSARLQIVGSGIGSVPAGEWVKELPELAKVVAQGAFDVRARAVPLARVERAWDAARKTSDRIVLVP